MGAVLNGLISRHTLIAWHKVLFMVALVLMLVVDKLLNFVFPTGRAAAAPKELAA